MTKPWTVALRRSGTSSFLGRSRVLPLLCEGVIRDSSFIRHSSFVIRAVAPGSLFLPLPGAPAMSARTPPRRVYRHARKWSRPGHERRYHQPPESFLLATFDARAPLLHLDHATTRPALFGKRACRRYCSCGPRKLRLRFAAPILAQP